MSMRHFFGRRIGQTMAGVLIGAFALAAPAALAGGKVLPAQAHPTGSTLADAAKATAVYNTGGAEQAPAAKYQILTLGDATVAPGTFLYVPVFFADDSPPVNPASFPASLDNQQANADYLLSAIEAFTGLDDVVATFIEIDGDLTVLDANYVSGVTTAPLGDGGGTHYIVSAAFVNPLKPGEHTLRIGAVLADGTLIGPPASTITVK
jgi:hypothetical protein